MNIQNRKQLQNFAAERLQNTREDKKIVAIYAAVVIGLSVLSSVLNYALGLRIDQSGGLSNIGTRTALSTLQTMLPLVQSLVVMCVEVGYLAAMLRIARGQYVSVNTLRLGFDRFWVLLRTTVLKSLIMMGISFASLYFGVMVYMMTPLSASARDLLMPLISQVSTLDPGITISDALYNQLMTALLPAFAICGLIFCVAGIPVFYQLRMTSYVIIDKPALGAIAAMRESFKMMRKHRFHLFRLDVSLWWFYLASVAASVVCYGDMILPMMGIELPMSAEAAFFLFYGFYWALEFAIFYFLRNRVDVTYALAYDSIRPRENTQDGGVVLGNIFHM